MSKDESDKKLNKPKQTTENSSTSVETEEEDSDLSNAGDVANSPPTNNLQLNSNSNDTEAIKTQKDNSDARQIFRELNDRMKQSSKGKTKPIALNSNKVNFSTKEETANLARQFSKEATNLKSVEDLTKQNSKETSKRHSKSSGLNRKGARSKTMANIFKRLSKRTYADNQRPRNSMNELVEMMLHFNLNPVSSNRQAVHRSSIGPNVTISPPALSSMFSSSNLNESNTRPESTRADRRLFSYLQNSPSYNQQPTYSSPYQNIQPTNFDPRTLLNSTYSTNPYSNRQDLVDTRILTVFEQITSLLDRFLAIISDFRDELTELQNRDMLMNRMVLAENNAQLIDAITNVLPDRLGERFSRELERALAKHFGTKKSRQNKL